MTAKPLAYPPPWMDMPTLCAHICVSDRTVDAWVKQGILPSPYPRGGKNMWRWAEVDEYLAHGGPVAASNDIIERVKNGTRRALAETRTVS